MKKTLALYETTYGCHLALEYYDEEHDREYRPEYVRVTEPADVDFTDLDRSDVAANKVAAVDESIMRIRADITLLEQEKAGLMAQPATEVA
jgi:hypothetical protein